MVDKIISTIFKIIASIWSACAAIVLGLIAYVLCLLYTLLIVIVRRLNLVDELRCLNRLFLIEIVGRPIVVVKRIWKKDI